MYTKVERLIKRLRKGDLVDVQAQFVSIRGKTSVFICPPSPPAKTKRKRRRSGTDASRVVGLSTPTKTRDSLVRHNSWSSPRPRRTDARGLLDSPPLSQAVGGAFSLTDNYRTTIYSISAGGFSPRLSNLLGLAHCGKSYFIRCPTFTLIISRDRQLCACPTPQQTHTALPFIR